MLTSVLPNLCQNLHEISQNSSKFQEEKLQQVPQNFKYTEYKITISLLGRGREKKRGRDQALYLLFIPLFIPPSSFSTLHFFVPLLFFLSQFIHLSILSLSFYYPSLSFLALSLLSLSLFYPSTQLSLLLLSLSLIYLLFIPFSVMPCYNAYGIYPGSFGISSRIGCCIFPGVFPYSFY
jgi:hypothetical protein